MFEPLLQALRDQVSGARALAAVEAVSRFHRVQASPGYDDAASWLAGELEASGLKVALEHAPGDGIARRLGALMPEGWECSQAHATLVDGRARATLCDYARLKLSLILRSAPARGKFPIVVLEDGTEDEHYRGREVRGRIVLTRGAVQRVHQLAVVERGAAGLLFDGRRLLPPVRGPLDDPEAVAYTSFWWHAGEPRGWGFVVSPAAGARLRERLAAGSALELEVEIESRRFPTRIPLLSATLPGASEREVLVLSHLCHPEPSANDNGSGVAAALESARALAALGARPGARPRSLGIRFLWMPELTGTHAWLAGPNPPDEGLDAARARRTVAALNLDMVGEDQARCGSTLLIEHPPCFAGSFAGELLRRIRERAQDWVTSYSGPGHFSLTRMGEVPYGGGSDHAVLVDPLVGIPCPMLIQWPDRYYHSSHDTPDKCDPASLALAARCAATFAGFLASADAPERAWLAEAVERGSQRRRLDALDHPEPARTAEAEALRARATLASLRRLDAGAPAAAPSAAAGAAARSRTTVPVRPPGPLEMHRHLLAGYAALSREERERFRRFEAAFPGGTLALELAWFACDGRRTVGEIARLVWLETGGPAPVAPERLAEFFGWTARLARSGWSEGADRP
jgi:aminopeptidase YwaD